MNTSDKNQSDPRPNNACANGGTGSVPSENIKIPSRPTPDDTEVVPPSRGKPQEIKLAAKLVDIDNTRVYMTERPGLVTVSDHAPVDTGMASEGIWYAITEVECWKLFAYPFTDGSKIVDHSTFWKQIIAPWLVEKYKLPRSAANVLMDSPYGVPRGRVSKVGKSMVVYHSEDWASFPAPTKVAEAFHLPKAAKWVFDKHQTRHWVDCMDVERLLSKKHLIHTAQTRSSDYI
ncbi:hypothetical protein M2103_001299 [Ereboglobus sp. PH5-5]|uniref:hypothetical protein n=1 Tax=Ereboglobus sp. PH5-5 TaxID=2940529 RepID=UPI002405DFEE|nr:hypothetical protein [Ereboglobus sp. PH5-5]MDF9833082.1 hypothetical protein [Ereboglobus sp. PH5-5]